MSAIEDDLTRRLSEVGPREFTARDYRPGTIRHVVLFRYREEVTPDQKTEVLRRFRALATSTRADGRPYVVSLEAGEQANGEGAGGGFEHGIVVTFASEGDRNHYVGTPVVTDPEFSDAAHAAFKEFVGPFLAADGVLVFDVADPADPADPAEGGSGWLTAYRGLPWAEARDRAEAAGRTVRVLRPGSVVTMDFRPDRLNLRLDEHDDLVDVSAG